MLQILYGMHYSLSGISACTVWLPVPRRASACKLGFADYVGLNFDAFSQGRLDDGSCRDGNA